MVTATAGGVIVDVTTEAAGVIVATDVTAAGVIVAVVIIFDGGGVMRTQEAGARVCEV